MGILVTSPAPPNPTVEILLRWKGQEISILGVHPTSSPTTARDHLHQQHVVESIIQWTREARGAVIVVGDLNMTHRSRGFRRLVDGTGLTSSQLGYGQQASWPTALPRWAGIAIDHCLHSPELITVDRRVGPYLGSDHRPLHVALQKVNSATEAAMLRP